MLSLFLVIVVTLVFYHHQTNYLLNCQDCVPTAQHKHLGAGLLWGLIQISSLPLDQILPVCAHPTHVHLFHSTAVRVLQLMALGTEGVLD